MAEFPDNSEIRKTLKENVAAIEGIAGYVPDQTLPPVKLEEKTYTPATEGELRQKAADMLSGYVRDSKDAIYAQSKNEEQSLRSQREEYDAKLQKAAAELEDRYNSAASALDNDLLKRGLARSSIAANSKTALIRDYADRDSELRTVYGKKLDELDNEIAQVTDKLNKALDDFNISFAVKLNETLEKLRTERDKQAEAVLEYNNSIRAQQAKLDADRALAESKLYSQSLDNNRKATSLDGLTEKERNRIYEAVYDEMDKFLAALGGQNAKLELLNHTYYREHLNNYYYNKLLDKYAR